MTVRILLCGYGRMGKMLHQLIDESADLEIAGIIDIDNAQDLETENFHADVLIDFSGPGLLPRVAEYVERTGTGLVSGATGYADQGAEVKALGRFAPVIYSENYSVGVNVMAQVALELSALLGDEFDVELSETHHRYKKDAPSGTARLLLRSVDPEGQRPLVYGRSPEDEERHGREIGVHSLRGGTVPGQHTLSFFGEDETLEITHTAFSRTIFAQGALTMARRIASASKGTYTFAELLKVPNQ